MDIKVFFTEDEREIFEKFKISLRPEWRAILTEIEEWKIREENKYDDRYRNMRT